MKHLEGKQFYLGNEKISLLKSSYNPGIEEHDHDCFEIAYITKGKGVHIINNIKHPVSEGSILLISRKSIHTYYTDSELEWINIIFDPNLINMNNIDKSTSMSMLSISLFTDLFNIDSSELIDIELSNLINIDTIIKEMLREYNAKNIGYQEILFGYLQVVLISIFRSYFLKSQQKNDESQKLLNAVIDYLDKNMSKKISLQSIAKRTFVSPRYFQILFKNHTGETLTTFIRKYKIEKAKNLLINSNMNVIQIMQEVNIPDQKNFYSTFKKFTGMTPLQYRKEKNSEL